MSHTLTCPSCQYTLHGDQIEIIEECNICKLSDTIANLSVSDVWKLTDALKRKEKEGNFTLSGIIQRGDYYE